MEFLLLFAFAVLFAIAFNYGQPKALGYFPSLSQSFWGVTIITAASVLVLLVAVSWVFSEVGKEVVAVK